MKNALVRTLCIAAIVLSVFVASNVCAQSDYAGAFLEIPVGAHALSMGGAYTAIANDESAFHWNPSGVSLVTHRTLGLMYSAEYGTPGSSLANFWQAGFTYPLKNVTLAANWVRLGVPGLVHTPDLTGVAITGERERLVRQALLGSQDLFSDNEDAFVITAARNNKFTIDWGWLYFAQQIEVPIGINFKFIHQSIGNFGQATGLGIDVGGMFRFSLGQFLLLPALGNLSLGGAITDIFGTNLNWSTQRQQRIPSHINMGIAYSQDIPFLHSNATFSGDFLVNEQEKPRFGMDITYLKDLSLRVGINRGLFAAGAGFDWEKKLRIDYSLGINAALGPEHRLSFAVDFDNLLQMKTGE